MSQKTKTLCDCPSYPLMKLISKKWVMMILCILCDHQKMRYSDIKKELPDINSRMLSERLSELEKEGFIERRVENSKPIVISYQLTEKALDLKELFCGFLTWAKKWARKKSR